MLRILFLFLILISTLYSSEINFTQEEKNFIKKNPVIHLASSIGFEPFIMKNNNGSISGYEKDLLDIVSKKSGLKFTVNLGNWSKIQKKLNNRKYDGFPSAGYIKKREKLFNRSETYIKFSTLLITKKGNPKNIISINDLDGKTIAMQKDNKLFEKILAKLDKNVTITNYDTIEKTIQAVVSNKADFLILDETIFYLAKQIGLEGMIEVPFAIGDTFDLMYWFRKDYPELTTIFNKVLQNIDHKTKLELRDKWFSGNNYKKEELESIELNIEQKNYLSKKANITMCIDPNWLPFSKLENNKHIGMSADIYKLISNKLPIPIKLVPTSSWIQSLTYAEHRKCDILEFAIKTPKREKYLNFTDTFLEIPLIIVTRLDIPFVYNFEKLKGEKIGIPKGYAYIEILKSKYPYLNIIEVENISDGLQKVKDEELFGFLGTLASVAHVFKKDFTGELKVTARMEETFNMGSAVRNDDPMLFDILQKTINSIPKEEIDNIISKWINIKYEKRIDYSIVWKIIFLSILIITVIFAFLLRERKLKEKLKDSKEQLEILATTDKLTGIYNRTKLDEILENELKRANRYDRNFACIIIDIDYFKKVNDTYGHLIGDIVLKQLSKIVKDSIRSSDYFGRWGGEEFLLIIPETKEKELIKLLEKIRVLVSEHKFEKVGQKTISIGATLYTKNDTKDSIMKRADEALYTAKESGRNRIIIKN